MAKIKEKKNGIEQQLRISMPRISEGDLSHDPNRWFASKFPAAIQQYGAAFLKGEWMDSYGFANFVPVYLNEDFFAVALGGDSRLGHEVIFYPPENLFYFYDFRVEAFCPTTEEKLKLLLSNYLVRCSQESSSLVDITNLMVKFREEETLNRVIAKAKAVLEAERGFFEGKSGQRRLIDGRMVDPSEEPLYKAFVKARIVREPNGKLTVADAFHRYYQFCKIQGLPHLTRADFKSLVAEVIKEEFNLGLRHDVPDQNGKQQHGWMGLDVRADEVVTPFPAAA